MSVASVARDSRAGTLPLVGGELAFDFTNTSSGRGTPTHQEHLRSAEHVVVWACHAGILQPYEEAASLLALTARPELGLTLLNRALALREALYEIGTALAAGRRLCASHLDELAAAHAAAIAEARLVADGERLAWRWRVADAPVGAIIGPITLSALSLLLRSDTGPIQGRIKQCAGHQCGWLFFDATRNNSRRWCEMEVCGNRAKQKRRRKAERRAQPGTID
jgi:predicted RNA-binding Zn ribbon-like protein